MNNNASKISKLYYKQVLLSKIMLYLLKVYVYIKIRLKVMLQVISVSKFHFQLKWEPYLHFLSYM